MPNVRSRFSLVANRIESVSSGEVFGKAAINFVRLPTEP